MKQLIKSVFDFCIKNEKFEPFLAYFFENGVMKTGIKGVTDMRALKAGSVQDYFSNETKVLEGCNPYMIKFIVDFFMDNVGKEACKKVIFRENVLSNIFGLHICQVFLLQKDPVVKKLLK